MARYHGIAFRTAFTGFGALEKSKINGAGNRFLAGLLFALDKIVPSLTLSPTYGENEHSFNGIRHGYEIIGVSLNEKETHFLFLIQLCSSYFISAIQ